MSRCHVCGQDIQDDGYGEPVHVATGLYGSYSSPQDDPKHGRLEHVAA